ncbi:hypothetical protein BDQ17DRAFT_1387125 [Cyathus striatus]|nr:hypothetical protein BDQ17DRAFT_1387125 [Cyathus striatus]
MRMRSGKLGLTGLREAGRDVGGRVAEQTSTDHGHYHKSSPAPSLIRRRRKDRACDACRRRKTKCDGPFMPGNRCTSCIQSNKPCTYVRPATHDPSSHKNRQTLIWMPILQIYPGVDFSDELGPPVIRDSWKSTSTGDSPALNALGEPQNYHRPDLLRKRSLPSHLSLPSISGSISPQVISGPQRPRSRKSEPRLSALYLKGEISEDVSSGEDSLPHSDNENLNVDGGYGGVIKLTHVTSEKHEQKDPNGNRFHGRSSTMGLVEVTRHLKNMHLKEAMKPSTSLEQSEIPTMLSRRPEFWDTPSWEQLYEGHHIDSPTIDLAEVLIDLYFLHWRDKLHHRDIWYADVCLSLFSVASRWCDDPRILPEGTKTEYGESNWTLAGWRYYEPAIGVHRLRRSLLYPVTLFEIQTFTLLAMFIRGTQSHPSAWIFVNVGLRKAQDVGAHRKKVYHERPNVEDELWKRAFWHLVIFDRMGGVGLGRACSIQEEDFDLDPLLKKSFKQPPGIPSKIAAFNEFIKLTQIMAFTMKTLYCIDQTKVFGSLFVGDWREKVISELTHALQKWIKEVPDHLRWSEKMHDPIFAGQSATVFTAYYLTEILIYRPFIPNQRVSSSNIPPFSYSAFDVCIKAARASARITKVEMERGLSNVPNTIAIWEKTQPLNESKDTKPPLAHQIDGLTNDVKIFVNALEYARPRWSIVQSYL